MNVILDTHIAIWALLDSPKLSDKARAIILDPDNTLYFSVISAWEVLLKHDCHPEEFKLTPEQFSESCREAGFIALDLRVDHIMAVSKLPKSVTSHKDPFDRLLIAQAKDENMGFLTCDHKLMQYGEKCVIAV